MFLGKFANRFHHSRQRRCLVVGEIGEDRDERAIAIEELGIPCQCSIDLRCD
ncbi:hypothetical protein D3C85_1852350 [compost metagenome]